MQEADEGFGVERRRIGRACPASYLAIAGCDVDALRARSALRQPRPHARLADQNAQRGGHSSRYLIRYGRSAAPRAACPRPSQHADFRRQPPPHHDDRAARGPRDTQHVRVRPPAATRRHRSTASSRWISRAPGRGCPAAIAQDLDRRYSMASATPALSSASTLRPRFRGSSPPKGSGSPVKGGVPQRRGSSMVNRNRSGHRPSRWSSSRR